MRCSAWYPRVWNPGAFDVKPAEADTRSDISGKAWLVEFCVMLGVTGLVTRRTRAMRKRRWMEGHSDNAVSKEKGGSFAR